ncbi:response regulator [Paraburkholderia sp. RL18-103-BIB-C]|uniref:response regulator transcription factor n=1 Tax=unclassified Paraburkholderia TaxID=2615204 RepID=UPI0038B75DA4
MQTTPVASIVDDDQSFRLALSSLVRSMGWNAHLYKSAEAFLDSDRASDTTCLLCDVRMPGMSGVEMHERLLARGIAPPTIFISAFPSSELEERVLSNGALVLLEKPPSTAALVLWLSSALRGT